MSATNEIFSPKTYLNKQLYDNLPPLRKSRHKVSSSSFIIPEYYEYDNILAFNYNVSQLKKMCKYYNQKVSGNKNELMKRLYNYLRYSSYAIKIQSIYRMHLTQRYIKAHGPSLLNKSKCVNETDFLTLDELTNIPHYQFYSYTDKDNFTYGFDIRSLYNLYLTSKHKTVNPYNRNEFPSNTIRDVRSLIRLTRVMKYPIVIEIEDETNDLAPTQQLQMRINAAFQKIDELGNYTDSTWFHNLTKPQLIRYLRELFDIWSYRAQLSHQVKIKICPPMGNPFSGSQLSHIQYKTDNEIKKIIIGIIEKLITRGVDEASKNLGAFYSLAALTLVNQDAAEALPWLYQSVMHN